MNEKERMELVKKLAQKAQIEETEAESLLEKNNWDILDCMLELERAGRIPGSGHSSKEGNDSGYSTQDESGQEFQQVMVTASRTSEESTGAKLKRILKKLVRKSLDNDFVVSRKEKEVLRVPVLVPIFMLVAWFGFTIVLFCVGLLTGFRYSFRGRDLGTEEVNKTMDKMAEYAEDIKVKVREFIDEEDTDSRG